MYCTTVQYISHMLYMYSTVSFAELWEWAHRDAGESAANGLLLRTECQRGGAAAGRVGSEQLESVRVGQWGGIRVVGVVASGRTPCGASLLRRPPPAAPLPARLLESVRPRTGRLFGLIRPALAAAGRHSVPLRWPLPADPRASRRDRLLFGPVRRRRLSSQIKGAAETQRRVPEAASSSARVEGLLRTTSTHSHSSRSVYIWFFIIAVQYKFPLFLRIINVLRILLIDVLYE